LVLREALTEALLALMGVGGGKATWNSSMVSLLGSFIIFPGAAEHEILGPEEVKIEVD
jgi:hypothetical protein